MAFIRVSDVVEKHALGTSLVVQGLGLLAPDAGGLGSIPGQGTRSHMLQRLKTLGTTTKTLHCQINNQINI